jgi:RNA polymerase sigma factor (sigma-70 family)
MRDESDMASDLAAMRRYARALARDDADADDVVQDALLRAIERQETFRPERSRTGWLLGIVHNVFVSAKRRQAAETRRNDRFAQTLLATIDPEQEEHLRLAEIARDYAALPDSQRAVMHLIAIEGFSYQATAELLNIPIGTVMSRLSRARAALREGQKDGRGPGLRLVGGRDEQ